MMETRREIAERLKRDGKSYAEIGALLRISRQRVHQILTAYQSPSWHKKRPNSRLYRAQKISTASAS
jgi:hypothetical protein